MIINYIVHSTSVDNEGDVVSGRYDVPLSKVGIKQASNLREILHKNINENWGRIFASTLQRSLSTARAVFPYNKNNIIQDPRLSEIDYGEFTHKGKKFIECIRNKYIARSYPKGESYIDVENRIRGFLEQYKESEIITIISHQAPQLALEVICNEISWELSFERDWRTCNKKIWQPYWVYKY
jgi:broad specificity phosphatase PhoE